MDEPGERPRAGKTVNGGRRAASRPAAGAAGGGEGQSAGCQAEEREGEAQELCLAPVDLIPFFRQDTGRQGGPASSAFGRDLLGGG